MTAAGFVDSSSIPPNVVAGVVSGKVIRPLLKSVDEIDDHSNVPPQSTTSQNTGIPQPPKSAQHEHQANALVRNAVDTDDMSKS